MNLGIITFKDLLNESSSYERGEYTIDLVPYGQKGPQLELVAPSVPYVSYEKKPSDPYYGMDDIGFKGDREYEISDESATVSYKFIFEETKRGITDIVFVPTSVKISFSVKVYEESLDGHLNEIGSVDKEIQIRDFSYGSKVKWDHDTIRVPLILTEMRVNMDSDPNKVGNDESWMDLDSITIDFKIGN